MAECGKNKKHQQIPARLWAKKYRIQIAAPLVTAGRAVSNLHGLLLLGSRQKQAAGTYSLPPARFPACAPSN